MPVKERATLTQSYLTYIEPRLLPRPGLSSGLKRDIEGECPKRGCSGRRVFLKPSADLLRFEHVYLEGAFTLWDLEQPRFGCVTPS
jgi:hypothetical protein